MHGDFLVFTGILPVFLVGNKVEVQRGMSQSRTLNRAPVRRDRERNGCRQPTLISDPNSIMSRIVL